MGTGMIGISAGQWAYKKGAASVTVIGRSEAKRTLVETCGLHYVNSSVDDLKEYDFVIEAVGSQYTIQQAISQTRPEGTVLLMGNPFGDINLDQNVYWKILRKQLLIKGTWNSKYNGKDFSDWTEAVKAIANNEINIKPLISHQYSEDKLFDGLKLMYNKQEPYCKVMTIWNKKTEI
ncbi:MAG TPA: zinc-binding dehydrogenase [Thomasclavelia ramosa]|nr:zinc-binding dehydrogenase [Thomasclavelia ramosa]